ncbi:L-threonine ammonia-lyase isoform X1 [Salmo salar]|uniref:L-serine deaminase n=2 Tax=Salmo salar TaxID=8030 RepID=A0A1S3RU50_SALSA|nr:L-threonine ammonia-lyase-like isoform X1 [Salmo salar]|eukprot:XP_014055831.1 PREDICTED: L-threonine ammonia-lyase-like isoform X1 [Salmo salar]
MNFAAQFIYANYIRDGSPNRVGFSDSDENDPFWQRWDSTDSSPTHCTPLDTEGFPTRALAADVPPQHPKEPNTPTAASTVVTPAVAPTAPRAAPLPVLLHPCSAPLLSPQGQLTPPSTTSTLHHLPSPSPCARISTKSCRATSKPLPHHPALPVPKSNAISDPCPPPPPETAPPPPSPRASPALPRSTVVAKAPLSRVPAPVIPSPDPGNRFLLPAFHVLVCLLLRLVLSFILFFLPSEEQRLGSTKQGCSTSSKSTCNKDAPVCNGVAGVRPTLIHPERLKDFGIEEEECLNGEVKTKVTKVVGAPEIQLMDPPKTNKKRGSESKAVTPPKPEYLRFDDISAAAFKIQLRMQKTPCMYSRLSKQYGMEIFLKKEHLHYTGSVKERGVLYVLTSLNQEQQKKGVIVATDCSFSMAVAHHAVELRIPVFVIMPASCAQPHLRMYRDYGAMVISYGSTARDSLNHARHLAKENGYLCLEEDDSAVYLAGLGTVGMEIYEQVPKLDAVIVPAGGQCSLLVGTAAAIKHLNSRITVIGVEPEGFSLLLQSLKTGSPVIRELYSTPNKKLYGDLFEHSMGTHTFHLAKTFVDKVISVREEDSLVAMLRFQEFEHSMVDTEGAMGLAAILAGQLPELKGKRVAVVVSSANMELDLIRQCVDRALVLDDRVNKFTVQLGDLPGDMAKLLDILAREDIKLLDVCHRRHNDRGDLFKALVECVVETRDKTQSTQLRRTLSERYPTLRWLDR